jgi:hypothetical protein
MFSLTTIGIVSSALRRASDRVPLNATWRKLNHEHGIGQVHGAGLNLTQGDRTHLRELVIRHEAFDPMLDDLASLRGDRMAIAKAAKNEKLSRRPVSEDIVLIGSANGDLNLPRGRFSIPRGTVLQMPASALAGLNQIVLVENLNPMYVLDQFKWPCGIDSIPMIFRGSPQYSPAAVSRALGLVERIICFPDFDPQGLLNSLCTPKVSAIVCPSGETIENLRRIGLDKHEDFETQAEARHTLRERFAHLPSVAELLSLRTGISQESLPGYGLSLSQVQRE